MFQTVLTTPSADKREGAEFATYGLSQAEIAVLDLHTLLIRLIGGNPWLVGSLNRH